MMLRLYEGLNQTGPQHFQEPVLFPWLPSRAQTMLACIIFTFCCCVHIDPIQNLLLESMAV